MKEKDIRFIRDLKYTAEVPLYKVCPQVSYIVNYRHTRHILMTTKLFQDRAESLHLFLLSVTTSACFFCLDLLRKIIFSYFGRFGGYFYILSTARYKGGERVLIVRG